MFMQYGRPHPEAQQLPSVSPFLSPVSPPPLHHNHQAPLRLQVFDGDLLDGLPKDQKTLCVSIYKYHYSIDVY